jgi:alkylation response protein AidB-like acyl-CoA dehydrogenase
VPEATLADATALVDGRIDALLAEYDPRDTPERAFWGAQYDLGLAWIHFPEGLGGLGLDPGYQDLVDGRLMEAGAPFNLLRNMMGVGMAAPDLHL